jgi:hypothetical protein
MVALYTALRIALIPDAAQLTNGFGHDSAYLSIVARNLLAGRGFVNEAQWVVFLSPQSLPMPYHNGNPLFPVAVAALSKATGETIFRSGFIISAVSSSILLVSLTSIISLFTRSVGRAFLLACATAFFPAVLADSLALGTDGLSTALFFAFLAALLRLPSPWMPIAGGVLLGLSWLTRPQVMVVLPAVLLYVALKWRSQGMVRLGASLAVAVAVISPWLVHTYRVWHNPFRSDSSIYLLQDYYVDRHPEKWGTHYDRVIHSLDAPPGVGGIVKDEPLGLPKYLVHAIPRAGKQLAYYLALERPFAGLLLAVGVLFALRLAVPLTPEAVALLFLALTVGPALAMRSLTFELRYFSILTTFFALFAAAGYLVAWDAARRRGMAARIAVGGAAVLLWAVIVPRVATNAIAGTLHSNDPVIGYLQLAQHVKQTYSGTSPVVVGKWPYFYSLETSASGLAIPWDHDRARADEGLFAYMNKYGASYVLLTDDEEKYWRPEWNVAVPAELEPIARVDNSTLFRRRQAAGAERALIAAGR